MEFQFKLNQQVTIATSGERGVVKGRAEYTNAANSYYVQYKAADGRACNSWWDEDALSCTCPVCGGSKRVRHPYSREVGPCAACTSAPISTATATTDASPNPSGSSA